MGSLIGGFFDLIWILCENKYLRNISISIFTPFSGGSKIYDRVTPYRAHSFVQFILIIS